MKDSMAASVQLEISSTKVRQLEEEKCLHLDRLNSFDRLVVP